MFIVSAWVLIPPSKPHPSISSDLPRDNSNTLNMVNNKTYTNFEAAYTHVTSVMVSYSKIIWITNSSNHRRV